MASSAAATSSVVGSMSSGHSHRLKSLMTSSGGNTSTPTSGSVSNDAWYHDSTGTTQTAGAVSVSVSVLPPPPPPRSFGRVCTPRASHSRSTAASFFKLSSCVVVPGREEHVRELFGKQRERRLERLEIVGDVPGDDDRVAREALPADVLHPREVLIVVRVNVRHEEHPGSGSGSASGPRVVVDVSARHAAFGPTTRRRSGSRAFGNPTMTSFFNPAPSRNIFITRTPYPTSAAAVTLSTSTAAFAALGSRPNPSSLCSELSAYASTPWCPLQSAAAAMDKYVGR
eukprot:29507-Pelagococcus_subviridis.AAC.1